MSLRLLSARIVRSSAPLNKAASLSIFRGYATKKFTEDHEWVSIDNGVGTVGITTHAQKTLGDIVFVEVPATGNELVKGETVGVVESVKAAGDLITPVSGEVVEANDSLVEDPSAVNSGPEDEGWLFKVKLSDNSELDSLLDEATYNKFCEAEEGH
ncbi:unnamed protein product [Absidia cylindrospora]